MKKEKLFLFFLILVFFIINYSFLNGLLIKSFKNYETGVVQRVIDGDTIVVNGAHIRLLGMNAPEKGEPIYNKAKQFMVDKILGKEVQLYWGKTKYDRYKRKLDYIFLDGKNINLESVRLGYANYYFPEGKTKYYPEFVQAWKDCLAKNKNLCKKSTDTCLILEEWEVSKQRVVLKNICPYELDIAGWTVKDEGRKKYTFSNKILQPNEEVLLVPSDWKKKYVWTNTGDSIFIRDDKNNLVVFKTY